MQHKTGYCFLMVFAIGLFSQTASAQTDWVGDFYNSAGASANVTSPQVLSSQNVVGFAGGGMSWRVPNKNFQLLQVTPPSLKGGCGGIDAYLGGFSFPNKAAFVNALRNFGQASVGYFFNLALKTMAPEIESTLSTINDIAMTINNQGQNSCALAKKAVDKVANALYDATANDTANTAVAEGSGPVDSFEAKEQSKADGYWETVRKRFKQLTGKDRSSLNAADIAKTPLPERNLLHWMLGKANSINVSDDEKELIMSLIGPSLIVKGQTDKDGEGSPDSYGRGLTIGFRDLVGISDPKAGPPPKLTVLKCTDGFECLTVSPTPYNVQPFSNRIQSVINKIMNGVANGTPPAFTTNEENILRVTQVPIARAAAMAQSGGVGATVVRGMLDDLRDFAAIDAATNFVNYYLTNTQRAIVESGAAGEEKLVNEVERIESRIVELKKEMGEVTKEVYARGNPFQSVEQLQRIERFMYANLNSMLAANARFKNRN